MPKLPNTPLKPRLKQSTLRILLVVAAVSTIYVLQNQPLPSTDGDALARQIAPPTATVDITQSSVETAFATKQSHLWVETSAEIERILSDDHEGARHQRLVVRLSSGHSLLIAHNIDLAARVPKPQVGAAIRFRGEYIWNAQGGVVHWTHRDPSGRYGGGWLEYHGQRFD